MPQVACIFGGTRGIGLAVARRFLREGCAVAVASSHEDNVNAAVDQLRLVATSSDLIHGICCDVRQESDVRHAIAWTEEKVGPIRYSVNSSGINIDKLLLQTPESDMRSVLDTNLVGSILCSKAVLKHMMRRREGSIINIGSIVGTKGNVGQTVYSASKAALAGFTKSLAKEVASRGITVNLVVPGFIATQMTKPEHLRQVGPWIPLRRVGSSDEAAEAVYFLATASYMTGQEVFVDGGLQLNF